MFNKSLFLTSTTLLVLLSTFGQPVVAQTRAVTPKIKEASAIQRNTEVKGNAATIGPVEVGFEVEPQRQPTQQTRVITISPEQKVRLAPGPALPGKVGPADDRGIQVQINNP